MGLFTNSKKLCPICAGPTPRMFSTKVEGMPLCRECGEKVDLPDGMIGRMSLEAFRQYIAFYDENKPLRDCFVETDRFSFSLFGDTLRFDSANRLFRLKPVDSAIAIEGAALLSFRILEDNSPLFESGEDVLKCYQSSVPDRVREMAPQLAQFAMQVRMYEQMHERERRQEGMEEGEMERNGEAYIHSSGYYSRPGFEEPVPFRKFYVEITMDHPYWSMFCGEMPAPSFDRHYPSIDDYLNDYRDQAEKLHTLASTLMQLKSPGAKEIRVDGSGIAAPVLDAAAEIQKFKALMDSGVITEEEFMAKKRQLLGI